MNVDIPPLQNIFNINQTQLLKRNCGNYDPYYQMLHDGFSINMHKYQFAISLIQGITVPLSIVYTGSAQKIGAHWILS